MTHPQPHGPVVEDGKDDPAKLADAESAPPAPAPPEPMTPARVLEWNAYYDLYVAGFVLLLAFFASTNRLQAENSVLWSWLNAGREIARTGRPVVTNATTIAAEGQRWVNVPWLFEWASYAIYSGVAKLAPSDAVVDTAAKVTRGDQIAVGVLIGLTAVARALTAFLLLGLRRKGPGLWWTAVCVSMAVGVFLVPIEIISMDPAAEGATRSLRTVGIQLGGLARPALVAPSAWGALLLAGELLLLFRAMSLGRPRALLGLIPMFLVWANVDDSFGFGLLVLLAAAVGSALDGRRAGEPGPAGLGWVALGGSVVATLVSPSHVFGWVAAFEPILSRLGFDLGPQTLSIFNKAVFTGPNGIYFAFLVGAGLSSFALNRRRFRWSRLLVFAVASALWAMSLAYLPLFALVLAAVLATNGQEWYLDAVGTEGRLGAGWYAWSTGGRLVTLAAVVAAIAQGLTGWGGHVGEAVHGFGFNADEFPFEVAESLKDAPIQGGILNTTLAQGDVLAWRVPNRKSFIDSRNHLFKLANFREWEDLRLAIRDDDVARWKPILEKGNVSAILIQAATAPRTYTRLMTSPNWIPFHDDGMVQMFGRADSGVPAEDLAYFRKYRLDPTNLAYKEPRTVPPFQRPPTETSEVDKIFQNRMNRPPQPHVEAAGHWLAPVGIDPNKPFLPEPARCLLAVREARTALASNPDDPLAFQRLIDAYQLLLLQESALISGLSLTPENAPQIVRVAPQTRLLASRARQLIAAMNYAVQTLPPPRTSNDRRLRTRFNLSMAQLYMQMGILDLARDRLALIDLSHPEEFSEDEFRSVTQQLNDLNQRLNQVNTQIDELVIQQRISPAQKAEIAQSQGAAGLAIAELKEANESGGGGSGGVKPTLIDLYCETGQPDLALLLLSNTGPDDPSLSTGVGTASFRQGRIHFLTGNYVTAVELFNTAIAQLRSQRAMQAVSFVQILLAGEPQTATKNILEVPGKLGQQGLWEFELGLAALEGGLPPEVAADHFTKALTVEPDMAVRPVIAYYLEKLGKPVPPPRPQPAAEPAAPEPVPAAAPATPVPAAPATPEPAKPATPEPAKPEAPAPAPAEPPKPDPAKPATPEPTPTPAPAEPPKPADPAPPGGPLLR